MRALNVVPYMTYTTKEDLHHKFYGETKSGVKVPTYNRTNNNPNGHFAQQGGCSSGFAVDGNRNNDRRGSAWSGRVAVDANRDGGVSEPAWQGQSAYFGTFSESTAYAIHQEDKRYADDRC